MMKNEFSNRDLELLSAYLDQELNPKEKARVEAHLQTSPQLRRILGELHQNRAALRSLPRLRAPRNFTLTPEIAGIKPKKRTYPVFGLVSALSSLVLILVLAGDFLINPAMTTLQPPAEQPASLATTGESAEALDTMMEKALEDIPSTQIVEEVLPMTEAESATDTDIMQLRVEGATEEPTEETPLGIEMYSSNLPEATLTTSPEVLSSITTPTPSIVHPTETPTIALPSATIESEMEERIESIVHPTPTTIEPQSLTPGMPFIRILELSLAAITLITGLIAIILRSKFR
jgi:hypothetical protein